MSSNGSENLSRLFLVTRSSGTSVDVDVYASEVGDRPEINRVKVASVPLASPEGVSQEGLVRLATITGSWRQVGGQVIDERPGR